MQINLNISREYEGGHVIKNGKNSYQLDINPDRMSRLIARHELYHVYCDENNKGFGLFEEWAATSYSLKKD